MVPSSRWQIQRPGGGTEVCWGSAATCPGRRTRCAVDCVPVRPPLMYSSEDSLAMQEFHPQNLRYTRLVDRYSRYIESPVLRLKFLKNALQVDPPRNSWKRLPFVGSLPDRAMIIVELSKVLPLGQPAPLGIKLASLMYRVRYALYAMCVAVAIFAGATLVYAVSRIVSSLSVSTEAKDIAANNPPVTSSSTGGEAVAAIASG